MTTDRKGPSEYVSGLMAGIFCGVLISNALWLAAGH